MTECPRCHGANMMKTIFGSFKCPQCLYNGTKLKRKGKRNVFGVQKTYRSSGTISKKPKGRSGKKREQKTDPFPQYLQEDTTELIEIVTLRKTARTVRLTAIQALGEKADPRALELLMPFVDHQDMDFRRYARRAIESIDSRQKAPSTMQSQSPS